MICRFMCASALIFPHYDGTVKQVHGVRVFQPDIIVMMETGFIIINEYRCRNMHCIDKDEPLPYAAFSQAVTNGRCILINALLDLTSNHNSFRKLFNTSSSRYSLNCMHLKYARKLKSLQLTAKDCFLIPGQMTEVFGTVYYNHYVDAGKTA